MSNEIVKFSNQFNNVALKKFDAVHLDVLMAIASRVREKGTATVEFSFEELLGGLFEDKREAREARGGGVSCRTAQAGLAAELSDLVLCLLGQCTNRVYHARYD